MVKLMPGYMEDVAAWQARLEDLAEKGWFYIPSWPFFYLASFERREPRSVRYRLEPAAKKEKCPDGERRETYRALGWEYVDTIGKSMHLWRCDDPDAPELHTDPETEAGAYDRLLRRGKISNWISIGLLLFLAGVIAVTVHFSGGGSFSRMVQSWDPLWRTAGYTGFWAAALVMAQWQARVLRRYLKALRAGVPGPHRRPYRPACALALVIDLLWVFYIIAVWCNGMHSSRRTFEQLDAFDDPVPYVTVSQNGEAWASPQENWLTREQWWTIEDYTEGRRYYRYSEAQYYRLRFPWMADDLVDSILAGYKELEWPVSALDAPGLDEVWTGETEDGYRYLILRLGDQVWDVGVRTERPLEELLAEYAAVLAEFQ